MNSEQIYVLGVGHNTLVYIDLVEACGYQVAGLYHYDNTRTGEIYYGYKILGSFSDILSMENLHGINFALSQGNNKIRSEIFNKIIEAGGNIPTLIHPSANVSRFATLGKGVVIHINAVVHPDVKIGNNTVLSYNTAITHSSEIGNHCYIASSSMIGAYTIVEDFVFIGIGSFSISGKVSHIGQHAYIGAGSLLTKPVEEYNVVVGRPAKVLRIIEKK